MRGQLTLFVDQFGNKFYAKTVRVTESLTDPKALPDTQTDVQTSARVNFMAQRQELAGVRRRLADQWITDQRRDELLKLTASMSARLQAGRSVDPADAERFNDLSNAFRTFDFLSVTAGVTKEDVRKDYTVLYKYPAAGTVEELKSLLTTVADVVPPKELTAVLTAQRSLIQNAQDLLVSGKYVP